MDKRMLKLVKVNNEEDIKNNIFLPKAIDRIEIGINTIDDVLDKFQAYYQVSKETVLIMREDEAIGIYGIREENDYTAIPWLLTMELSEKVIHSFIKLSILKAKELQKKYNVLYNYTSSENKISHRWLRFLGFTIDENNPLIISDEKILYRFEWRKE